MRRRSEGGCCRRSRWRTAWPRGNRSTGTTQLIVRDPCTPLPRMTRWDHPPARVRSRHRRDRCRARAALRRGPWARPRPRRRPPPPRHRGIEIGHEHSEALEALRVQIRRRRTDRRGRVPFQEVDHAGVETVRAGKDPRIPLRLRQPEGIAGLHRVGRGTCRGTQSDRLVERPRPLEVAAVHIDVEALCTVEHTAHATDRRVGRATTRWPASGSALRRNRR